MVNPIMTQTLPTIIGMGVVSRTTEVMFDKKTGKRVRRTKTVTLKPRLVGVAKTKAEATSKATKYRNSLRNKGKATAGRVKMVKATDGGYGILYYR